MTAKLYDHANGQWVDVPDDQVDGAIHSGKYTFEQGIQIPTVSPTGELGSIDSSDAYNAFTKNGFRWQNQADRNQYFQKESQAIREKAADAPVAAAAGGMARVMSGGLSDVIVPAAAELLSGGKVTREEGKQLLADTDEASPIASGAGTAVGFVVPNPASMVGGAVTEATQAAKVVSKIAPKVIGAAAEGATFGVGQTVSEQALGDHREVVDNLVSNVGLGTLLGGAGGAAFAGLEEAAPYLKQKLGKAIDKGSEAVRAAARGGAGNTMKAVLTAAGEAEAGAMAKDLATHPEFLERMAIGDIKGAEQFVKDANAARAEYAAQTRRAEKELAQKFSTLKSTEQHEITSGLERNAGDIQQTVSDLYARSNLAKDDFRQMLAEGKYHTLPHAQIGELEDVVRDAADKLAAKQAGRDLTEMANAKFGNPDVSFKQRAAREYTLADELTGYQDFRDFARQLESSPSTRKIGADLKAKIDGLASKIEDPAIEHLYQRVIRPQDAMDELHRIASSTIKDPDFKKLGAVLTSPEKFDAVRPMLENLADYAPELKQFMSKAATYQERQAALKQAVDKISQAKQQSVNGKVSLDDMEAIFKLVTPKRGDILQNIDRVREASAILQAHPEIDSLTAGVLFQRAMGKDVASMEKLLPLKDKMEQWSKLQSMDIKPGPVGQLAGPVIGSMVGGPAGAAVGTAVSASLSPAKAIKTLALIDKAAARGQAMFKAATGKLVDSLVSDTTRRAVTGAVLTKSERRQQYDKLAQQLPKLQDPDAMTNALSHATQGVQGMPSLKLELQSRLATAAGFLQSKLPVDVTDSMNPFGKSRYEPSDSQIETFMRYAQAVDKPLQVVEKMAEGTVTPEEIEALKVVHPDLFARLQRTVMDGIIQKGEELSYQAKLNLGQIFDIPTDYTLQPDFIAAMQDYYADQDQGSQSEQQVARPKTQTSKLKLNPLTTVATEAQKVSEGNYGET